MSATLAVTVLLGAAGACVAQSEPRPLVAVSCAGYDRLAAGIDAIGRWSGDAGLGQRLQLLMLTMPQSDATKGPLTLDAARPWGAVLLGDKPAPVSYVFLPVADVKPLVELVQGQLCCTVKVNKGVYQVPFGNDNFYAVHKHHWAFIAGSQEELEKVAADPETLLGDLPARYGLAIRASIGELPEKYRRQLPSWSLPDEIDDLLLGWNVDSRTETSYVDLELRARTGSMLAGHFTRVGPVKSDFAGLAMPNAAVTAIAAGALSDEEVDQVGGLLTLLHASVLVQLQSQGLSETAFRRDSRLLDALANALRRAARQKTIDGGLAIRLDAAGGTLLAGATLAGAASLETAFRQATEEIPENDRAARTIAVGAETYYGFHLHTISLAAPDRQLLPLVGDRLHAVVGIADDKLLIAAGRDALPTLKNAVDRLKRTGAKEVPPLKITAAVAPVARLLAKVGEDQDLKAGAAVLAGLFPNNGGQGCVTLSARRIPRGVHLRLQADKELLKALLSLGRMIGAYLPE
jgi:hypothetical protein